MPLGKSVSKNISELYHAKKGQKKWPRKRIVKASMEAARRAGGGVPMKAGYIGKHGKRAVRI